MTGTMLSVICLLLTVQQSTQQKPEPEPDHCQPYRGVVCSQYLSNRNIYVPDQNAHSVAQVTAALSVLSSLSMSAECRQYLQSAICYSSFPQCDGSSRKRQVCRDECEYLKNNICRNEYHLASSYFVYIGDMLPQCHDLPAPGTHEGENCVRIGVPIRSAPDNMDKCRLVMPELKAEQQKKGNCGNNKLRWIFNSGTKACESFKMNQCSGKDHNDFFTSLSECRDECSPGTGDGCGAVTPMCDTLDNICGTCRQFTDAICEPDPCTCTAKWVDPFSSEPVNCNEVVPQCQRERAEAAIKKAKAEHRGQTKDEEAVKVPTCADNNQYTPKQCDDSGCSCVDGTNKKTRKLENANMECPLNRAKALALTMRLPGDYAELLDDDNKVGQLKKVIREFLRRLNVPEKVMNMIKRIKLEKGSIVITIEVEVPEEDLDDVDIPAVANTIESAVAQGETLTVDGNEVEIESTVTATFEFEAQTGPPATTAEPVPTPEPRPKKTTIIIIVVVVAVALVIIIIIAVVVYKRKSKRGSKKDFSNLESHGRTNPTYENEKIRM